MLPSYHLLIYIYICIFDFPARPRTPYVHTGSTTVSLREKFVWHGVASFVQRAISMFTQRTFHPSIELK